MHGCLILEQIAANEETTDTSVGSMIAPEAGQSTNVQLPTPVSVTGGYYPRNDMSNTSRRPTQTHDLSIFGTSRPPTEALDLSFMEEPSLAAVTSTTARIPVIDQESTNPPGTKDELCIGPGCGVLQSLKMLKFLVSRKLPSPNVSADM